MGEDIVLLQLSKGETTTKKQKTTGKEQERWGARRTRETRINLDYAWMNYKGVAGVGGWMIAR